MDSIQIELETKKNDFNWQQNIILQLILIIRSPCNPFHY